MYTINVGNQLTNPSVTYSESEPEPVPQETKVGETDGNGFAIGKVLLSNYM